MDQGTKDSRIQSYSSLLMWERMCTIASESISKIIPSSLFYSQSCGSPLLVSWNSKVSDKAIQAGKSKWRMRSASIHDSWGLLTGLGKTCTAHSLARHYWKPDCMWSWHCSTCVRVLSTMQERFSATFRALVSNPTQKTGAIPSKIHGHVS